MRVSLLALATCVVALLACSDSSSDPGLQDAPDGGAEASSEVGDDVSIDTAPPGIPCETSITAACASITCPTDIDLVPPAAWCTASTKVNRSTTACANLQIGAYTDASGAITNVYFNSSTGKLEGVTSYDATTGTETCRGGVKGFRIPSYSDCAWVFGDELCATRDAGIDAASDAASEAGPDALTDASSDAGGD